MQMSARGLDLIKASEGCRLTAYQDSVGVWTIGWGETSGVHEGDTITQDQADAMLADRVRAFEDSVHDMITRDDITQGQFDALVDFCYNLGSNALHTSTLLHLFNTRDDKGAANQFALWVHAGNQVLPGLVTRRNRERQLFETGDWS